MAIEILKLLERHLPGAVLAGACLWGYHSYVRPTPAPVLATAEPTCPCRGPRPDDPGGRVTARAADVASFRQDLASSYASACLSASDALAGTGTLPEVLAARDAAFTKAYQASGASRFRASLAPILPEGGEPTPAQRRDLADFYRSLGTQLQERTRP